MNLILANENGFCYGVRDAIKKVNSVYEKNKIPINMYGDLIHNQESINELKDQNQLKFNVIHNLEDIHSQFVAIRAHGAGPSTYQTLKNKYKTIIDTTCPFVLKTQKIAKNLIDEGYFVFILGKKKHPEVLALIEYLEPNASIIETLEDYNNHARLNIKKIAIIFQSTVTIDDFDEIILKIIKRFSEVKIKATICDITTRRQTEVRELLKKVDYMIVLGGKNSSNTKKLFEICVESIPTIHIENSSELNKIIFSKIENLGLITGTSTSLSLVNNIINSILKLVPNTKIFKHNEI